MGAREEFYLKLNEDLILNRKASVLYEYIEEEQEARAGKGDLSDARSYQLRIRYQRKRYRNEEITPLEYLVEILDILNQSPKLCRRCGKETSWVKEFQAFEQSGVAESRRQTEYVSDNPEQDIRELLKAVYEELPSEMDIQQTLKELLETLQSPGNNSYRKAIEGLEEGGYLCPNSTKVEKLVNTVLDVAVAYDVREFFSGIDLDGSKVKRSKKGAGKRAERVDKTLYLLDKYCKRKGISLFQPTATSRASAMEYNTLLEVMDEEGDRDLFLPVYVDADTGCGIYILGLNHFDIYEQHQIHQKGKRAAKMRKEEYRDRNCIFVVTDYEPDKRAKASLQYVEQYVYNSDNTYMDYVGAREDLKLARNVALDEMREIFNGSGIPEFIRHYKYDGLYDEAEFEEDEAVREETRKHIQKCLEHLQ